jgi:hypothetical protein
MVFGLDMMPFLVAIGTKRALMNHYLRQYDRKVVLVQAIF